MTTELSLPSDIAWRRLAYTSDMIDENFGDDLLPPKWRSSLAVYCYDVPRELTVDSYPDGRVVYLRLTCSITGWNPRADDLLYPEPLDDLPDPLDPWQREAWDAIIAAGWADNYWPCKGAIAQIAVYPGLGSQVEPHDFPFIFDFEPKKRELFETRTETGEVLSGSTDGLNVLKGTTSVEGTEKTSILSMHAGFSAGIGPFSIGAGGSQESATRRSSSSQKMEQVATDSSRERRETQSHSTTLSQMHQMFNGYHLGTNRTVFVILPRPHTATSAETGPLYQNIINGERMLEGVQDIFLVVHVPDALTGVCVQANLDTAHEVDPHFVAEYDSEGRPQVDPDGRILIVTRRTIRACGQFDEEGRLIPGRVPRPPAILPPILFETTLTEPGVMAQLKATTSGGAAQLEAANRFNRTQGEIRRKLLSGFSAGHYRPRPFVETQGFRKLATRAMSRVALPLERLTSAGYLSADEAARLTDAGVRTAGDLFASGERPTHSHDDLVGRVRERLLSRVKHAAQPSRK